MRIFVHRAKVVITKAEIAVWPTRAPAPTATRPLVLRAHRMVKISAHPAKQASTRAGMNASRALPIRISTPTYSWGPAALATQATMKVPKTKMLVAAGEAVEVAAVEVAAVRVALEVAALEVAAFEIAMNYLRTILGRCRRRRKSVWPTRAPAPTVTRPLVLHAHRMVRISAHPAKQASTRAGMNASRALPIRISTPTHSQGPAALAKVGIP